MDGLPEGEGESIGSELEESIEPSGCFTDGEYYCSQCHHLTHCGLVAHPTPHITLVNLICLFVSLLSLCAEVPVLPGQCGCGLVENVVDAKEDLLPDSRAQLV